MYFLLSLLAVLIIVWIFLPNPGAAPPASDPAERTRSFPSAEQMEPSGTADNETPALPPEDIAPNPLLEGYIDQELRKGDYRFEVTYPNKEAQLVEQADGTHLFRLTGRLYTDKEEISSSFRIHLFSNKPEAYEAFLPIFSEDLSFQVEGDHFVFQLSHPEFLDPGLYYYLIEEAESGEVFAVGKVSVAG